MIAAAVSREPGTRRMRAVPIPPEIRDKIEVAPAELWRPAPYRPPDTASRPALADSSEPASAL